MTGNDKVLSRHKALSKAELKKRFEDMSRIKKTLTKDAAILEKNLMDFNKILDPLIDPESTKVLCWIRRPATKELENMIPEELLKYRGKPEEVPLDLMQKHQDFQFKMMANLIENPKKDAEWWKANANFVFQRLFEIHLGTVMADLGIMTENF